MTGPVLAIDPGPEKSSWVLWCPATERVQQGGDQVANGDLETLLSSRDECRTACLCDVAQLVIERPVVLGGHGASAALLETAYWAGVFTGAWPGDTDLLTYHRVRSHLTQCGSAKEAQVKQALISRFAPSGFGKEGKGTVKAPGPFHGVAGHMWSAVAVAVAWCDLRGRV